MRHRQKKIYLAGGILSFALATVHGGATLPVADYSIVTSSIDVAGTRAQSADYSLIGGTIASGGAGAPSSSANYQTKSGFAGQLYDLVELAIVATPPQLEEGGTLQLTAAAKADDDTDLAITDRSTIEWSIISGPLGSISALGIVTAGQVYQNTPARVAAAAEGLTGHLDLMVLNVSNDDFGRYANDQIDDNWQVQYFGEDNPDAAPDVDADGTGQTNLFKFIAGINPLDGSRFHVEIQPVDGHPEQMNISFSPVISGRTYIVEFHSDSIAGDWLPLLTLGQVDLGSQCTITDFSAIEAAKFYRVRITKP